LAATLLAILFGVSARLTHSDLYENASLGPGTDTTYISSTNIGVGGKIMTDQDALMVMVDTSKKLLYVDLYYSSISTVNSDSSRIFVKSQRSWSCSPLGNAHPFMTDQYTLGLSKNVLVQTGWNRYEFDPPIDLTSDTIYIWPDLIQQVFPRTVYSTDNDLLIRSLNGSLCASPTSSSSSFDYSCSLAFLGESGCVPFLEILDSKSECYGADTISAKTIIQNTDSITYLSKDEVCLDTSFTVDLGGMLVIDMDGCEN